MKFSLAFMVFFLGVSESAQAIKFNDPNNCQMKFENLCVKKINHHNNNPVDLSKISQSPEVLEAAKVVARKLKPYGMVYLTEGYRSPKTQEAIRATGVRAGPSSGPNASIHITGVAVDLEIYGGVNREKEVCAALNQILPMLKNKGGVIMEGYSKPGDYADYPEGVTNAHIDDSWGAKQHAGKAVNYTGRGSWCNARFGVPGGESAAGYAEMAKVSALPTQGPGNPVIVKSSDGTELHDTRVIDYKQKKMQQHTP